MPSAPFLLELRFSASNLINKDLFSLSDPFLVCHIVRDGIISERIFRTETVQDDLNPSWTTTVSLSYSPEDNRAHSPTLLVDIFDRDSGDNSSLTKHDFLGRAAFQLIDLINSKYGRLDLKLSTVADVLLPSSTSTSLVSVDDDSTRDLSSSLSLNSMRYSTPESRDLSNATTTSRAQKKVKGTVSVFAETLRRPSGLDGVEKVRFDISSAMLRDSGTFGRRVTQFFEIQRERIEGNSSTWSCVYRSSDGLIVDKYNYVQFEEISIPIQSLNNYMPGRQLRIAFYKRHTRHQHQLISFITFTMDNLLKIHSDLSEICIKMEGVFGDDDGLGNVIVQRLETSNMEEDEGTTVYAQLRADHFLHPKFVSSLNDSPKHGRRLRQLPSFITLH